jgi:hypothetical protein
VKELALNAWEDLREKRLWPLAVLLAIALVAVPVLLLKGKPDVPPPTAAKSGTGAATPLVAGNDTEIAGSSKLGSFNSKDPFRSLTERPRATSGGETPAGSTPESVALAGEAGIEPGGVGGPAGGPGGDAGGGPEGGGAPGGGGGGGGPAGGEADPAGRAPSSSGGSGGGGSDRPSSTPPPAPDPKFYEYVAEVDFGRVGDERRYRDVRALDSLPSKRRPVVVYLGQTRDNESAFLVNQAIGQRGEGNCVPNRIDCSIVYLRPSRDQNDHYFYTGEPNNFTYHLKLIAVRRKVDSRDASVSARSSAESSDRRTRTRGKRSKRTVRRTRFDFRIPMIAGQRR